MDKLKAPMRLVRVTWMDHSADKSGRSWDDLVNIASKKEIPCHSVGWLVKKDRKYTILASCISEDQGSTVGASVQIIMTAMITKMSDLVPKGSRQR